MNKQLFFFLFISIANTAGSQTVGWFYSNPGNADGYILFAPLNSDTTYLIDKCGKRIHTWASTHYPGEAVYLLENGSLLHTADMDNNLFNAGGTGGGIEKFDWDGNMIWNYEISDAAQCQHHDAIQLPNGNVIAIVWEDHTATDAIDNGRNPASLGTHIWSEKLVEIQPAGVDSGIIVWQWRAWDHLVQEFDNTKLNYGPIYNHPELLNFNLNSSMMGVVDWLHCNGLDYNAATDQLIVSCHNLNEVWIIDHSTTMEEAALHTGGQSGKGGDLLYRWGNPQNYGRGSVSDQKFYGQHNARWIPAGFPGAGDIMVYNNGLNRPGGNFSTAETFTPPEMVNYVYPLDAAAPYDPATQSWIYTASPPESFYSQVISGAQRTANGSTIICEGMSGTFFEVDMNSNDLWKYINPVSATGIITQGNFPGMNAAFRCVYYEADYPGLSGHSLLPGAPIEKNPLTYTCFSNTTGLVELSLSSEEISVFPNPFHSQLNLHMPFALNDALLQIHDLMGRLIYEEKSFSCAAQSNQTINILPCKGMMNITLVTQSGEEILNLSVIAGE